MMNLKFWIAAGVLAFLTGCTTLIEGNKVEYKAQGQQASALEMPPDFSVLTKNEQASVPIGGAANASAAQKNISVSLTTATAINNVADIRVMREGSLRWLVVDRAPEKLWDEIKKFWINNGLTIAIEQANIGMMETAWNENRAKLPQDRVRKILGKLLDGMYSTNERDKYRTRLERTANGGTEIYISHRGMMEDYVGNNRNLLQWRSRDSDPELEIELLKRLMIRLGGTEALAKGLDPLVAAPIARAKLVQDDTQSSLLLEGNLDQAWRRLGLGLDRSNFTIEDRDRNKGIYFVRYVDPNLDQNEKGFLAFIFNSKPSDSLQKYQLLLTQAALNTRVQVADAAGNPLNTMAAKKILTVLLDELK